MHLILPSLLAFMLVALAGCTAVDDDRTCPASNNLGRVTSIDGDTVRVQLLQSSLGYREAVLDTAGADFRYHAGSLEECYEAPRSHLAVGQEIEFYVDAWAKSEPPQATVDDVTIRG